MRLAVIVFCLACLALALTCGCRLNDGADADLVKATAVAGQDLKIDVGYAKLIINAAAIGTGAGQIPPGSVVSLDGAPNFVEDGDIYSPVLRVHAAAEDGSDLASLSLSPPAAIFLRYDVLQAGRDGHTLDSLYVLKKSGVSLSVFTHNSATTVTDQQFFSDTPGWVQFSVTSFSDFVVTESTGGNTAPEPVTLTGEVSTFLTFTVLSLANAGATIDATLAVPTGETTTVPNVLVLNDSSYDAGNPSAATNRLLTVGTGGVNYTTDAAGAAVTLTLNTFSGVSSSGSLVGTLIESGGSATLAINYQFSTDAAGATALTGTVVDIAGRRTLALSDSGQTVSVAVLIPDSLPAAPFPDDVSFDASTFDALDPFDPSGRVVTVSVGGESYTSDSASPAGDVEITFASFASGVSAGSIVGTVVSTGGTLDINFTFTTVAGASAGAGTLVADTPLDVDTSTAVESAVVFDGTNFVALWLSSVGTTNRTVQIQQLTAAGAETGAQLEVEPAAALQAAGGLVAAISTADVLVVVGATGANAATDSVIALVIDYATPAIVNEYNLGNGTNPQITFSGAGSGQFIVAYTTSAGVSVHRIDATGGTPSAAAPFLAARALTGLASAAAADDQVLITASVGNGVRAQRIVATTVAAIGTEFDISTTLAGGLCVFDAAGGVYLIVTQVTTGAFVTPSMRQLAPAGSVLHAVAAPLAGFVVPTQAASGNVGAMLADANAVFSVVVGDITTGPSQVADPLLGALEGLALDNSGNGAAVAADGAGHYLAACARGASGVSVIRFTVTP